MQRKEMQRRVKTDIYNRTVITCLHAYKKLTQMNVIIKNQHKYIYDESRYLHMHCT